MFWRKEDRKMIDSNRRPKLNIPRTKSEWVWDIIGYTFFICSLIFFIASWNELPDQVPAHYNAMGEVDRWGSKWELFILPGIGLFVIIPMHFLEKKPWLHNYPKRFNENNAKEFYILSRKLLNQLKNICLIIFSVLLLELVILALGRGNGMGIWLLPAIIIATMAPIVIGLIKQRKIR